MLTSGRAAGAGLTLGWATGTPVGAADATGLGASMTVARGGVVGLGRRDGAQAVTIKVVLASTRGIHLGMVVGGQHRPGRKRAGAGASSPLQTARH